MCLIIDANTAGLIGSSPEHLASRTIKTSIANGLTRLAIGGRLKEELFAVTTFRRFFLEAQRAGQIVEAPREPMAKHELELRKSNWMKSDDPHVLAVARTTGARILYSNDQALIDDFRNTKLVRRPKGKVITIRENSEKKIKRILALKDRCCKR